MSDEIASNFENLSIDKNSQNPEQNPDALEFDNNKPATPSATSTNNDDFSMDMGPSNPNFRPNKATNVPKKKMVMMRRTKDVIEKQEFEVKKRATDEARAREAQAKTIEQRQKEYQAARERLGITGTPSTESEGAQNQGSNQAENEMKTGSGNEIGAAVAPESAVEEGEVPATQLKAEFSQKAGSKEENPTGITDKATDPKTDTVKTDNNPTETCKTDQETTETGQKTEPTSKDTTPKSTVCSSQEAPQGVTTTDSGEAAAGDEVVDEAAELDKLIEQQTGVLDSDKVEKVETDVKNDGETTETTPADTLKSDASPESEPKIKSSNDQKPDKLQEKPRGRGTGILSRGNHHNSKPGLVSRNVGRPEGKGLLPLPAFVVNQGNNASLSQNNPSNQYPNYYQSGTNQPGLVQPGLVQTPQNGMQNLAQNPAQNPINNQQPGIQQQFSNWKQPEVFAPAQNTRGNYQNSRNRGGRGGMNNSSPRSPNPASTQHWNNGTSQWDITSNQPRPNFSNRGGGYHGNQPRGGGGQQRGRGGYNNYSPRNFNPQNYQNGQNGQHFGNGQNNSSNKHNSNRGGMNQNSYNSGHQGQQGNHAQNNRHNNQVHNSGHNPNHNQNHNSHNHQNGQNQHVPASSPHVHQNQQMNQQQHRIGNNNNVHEGSGPHVHNNQNQNNSQNNNNPGAHVNSNGGGGHQNQQNQFRHFEMPGQQTAAAAAQQQSFNQFNANYYQASNMGAQGARGDAAGGGGGGQFGNFGPATPPQFQNTTFMPAAQNFQVPSTQFQINSNAMRSDIGATGWGQPPIPSTTVSNGNMQATSMANPPQLSPSHPPSAQPGNNMNLFQNNNMATMS